jgi:hypothetical protein
MSFPSPQTVPTTTLPRREALGLPAGSIRALHTLLIVGLVCAILLLPLGSGRIEPVPPYLVYLLFLTLGHYFAAHGNSIARRGQGLAAPLYLPSGFVRLLIFVVLVGTVGFLLATHRDQLEQQMILTVEALKKAPEMPVIILGGFFLGVLFRTIMGGNKTFWMQDIQAWLSLVSGLLLGVAALWHLVIAPSLPVVMEGATFQGVLAGVVAFYYGERS